MWKIVWHECCFCLSSKTLNYGSLLRTLVYLRQQPCDNYVASTTCMILLVTHKNNTTSWSGHAFVTIAHHLVCLLLMCASSNYVLLFIMIIFCPRTSSHYNICLTICIRIIYCYFYSNIYVIDS